MLTNYLDPVGSARRLSPLSSSLEESAGGESQLQRGPEICRVICSKDMHVALSTCVRAKSPPSSPVSPVRALQSTGWVPGELPCPHALCLSCLPAAGVADGVARSHQLRLPDRRLLPSPGGLQEDDILQAPQPAPATSDYQGRYGSASAFPASPFPATSLHLGPCCGRKEVVPVGSPLCPVPLRHQQPL